MARRCGVSRMKRVALFALVVARLAFASAASADIDVQETSVHVGRHEVTSRPGGTGSAPAAYQDCVDTVMTLQWLLPGIGGWIGRPINSPATPAPIAYRSCTRVGTAARVGWVTGIPGVVGLALPTVDVLVAEAEAQLVLALPDVATSPPRGGIQLVSVPVWFWVRNFQPTGATAAIPGLSATITATPVRTTVVTGDGATVVCRGPGKAYDPGRSFKDQRSACSHPYLKHGEVTLSATVTWAVSWAASDGQSGVLPNQSRTTTFDLTIEEAQAVTD